jgi:DNA-binding transcriptional ArsR family regulator
MVEYSFRLDSVFGSLADATRRDILRRVGKKELSVGELAEPYDLTLAAISKHLKVLEKAKLIKKCRRGKQQFVSLSPPAFNEASRYLEQYRKMWEERLGRLEKYLKDNK